MKLKLFAFLTLAFVVSLDLQLSTLRAQGTAALTYQGRLDDAGNPANSTYDLTFALFNISSGEGQIGDTITNLNTAISNGLFTVTLDFGNQYFGAARWLEIGVRTTGGGAFTTLSPRQRFTPTPYAVFATGATTATTADSANSVAASNISGALPLAQLPASLITNTQTGVTLGGIFSGNGGGLTNLNAAQLIGNLSPANIGAGTISSTMLAAGSVTSTQLADGSVTSSQLAEGAVSMSKLAAAPTVSPSITITNPTPASYAYFGNAMAAVGTDKVLIGAFWDDTGAGNAGVAHLFSTTGSLLMTFANPTPASSDYFGNAVAAVGTDKVLIGAHEDDTGAANSGAAYLFNVNGTLLATFTNPTPASNDRFGSSVAALGTDRVIIGARNDDAGGTDAGAAYLFNINGTLLHTFSKPIPANYDNLGSAVASVGTDKLLIAADGDSTAGSFAGAAYLFDTNGTLIRTFFKPTTPVFVESFGTAVAALGADKLLIGVRGWNNEGSAYLFNVDGTLLTTFTNPTPVLGDYFGSTLSAVGTDRVLIGARFDGTGATNAGAAYLFSSSGALMATFNNPTPAADDNFGESVVAVGGNKLFIGSRFDDVGGTDAGVVHSFNLDTYVPGLISSGVVDGSITATDLDSSVGVWSKSGNNLYHNLGNVGIGTSTPSEKLHVNGNVLVSGTITGNGAGLTNLSAGNVSSGTIADARLSANVPLLNAAQVFTAQNTFSSLVVGTTARVNGNNNWGVTGGEGDFRVGNNSYRFKIGVANDGGGAGDVWMRAHGGIERVNLKAPGGTRILSNEAESAGVSLAAGGTSWGVISDRNVKKDFAAVDSVQILEKLAALPITQWHYQWEESAATPHIGPMAQDFKAAFYPGTDDKSITTQEADGVALAAIQGLNQKVEEKVARIQELEQRLERLEKMINDKHGAK
jgi:hypothetical protein